MRNGLAVPIGQHHTEKIVEKKLMYAGVKYYQKNLNLLEWNCELI